MAEGKERFRGPGEHLCRERKTTKTIKCVLCAGD